jgi:hypothetical protein
MIHAHCRQTDHNVKSVLCAFLLCLLCAFGMYMVTIGVKSFRLHTFIDLVTRGKLLREPGS